MRFTALKDICLTIPDGQFIGVIGHTGSGKSTLIQHLNALIRPHLRFCPVQRRRRVGGKITTEKTSEARWGLVFQYPEHQLFESDVLSDVCFGPMNQGLSREEAEKEGKESPLPGGIQRKELS